VYVREREGFGRGSAVAVYVREREDFGRGSAVAVYVREREDFGSVLVTPRAEHARATTKRTPLSAPAE
jgi:hypothetical protein